MSIEDAMERANDKKLRGSLNSDHDFKALTREDEERKGYSDNEGNYNNHRLAIKRKNANSGDRMPQSYESARSEGKTIHNI
jgi:hypothetical protein